MKPWKVLIVDDSAFMRKILRDMLEEEPDFTVVHTARNGKEAVELAVSARPDLITMDLEMPVMNGLEAIREIVSAAPVPIVILCDQSGRGSASVIRGLELGAVDFIYKPSGSISLDLYSSKTAILSKLRTAAQSKPMHLANRNKETAGTTPAFSGPIEPTQTQSGDFGRSPAGMNRTAPEQIVAIGTSTGGPKALVSVLSALPADFPAPLLVVQHMPRQFTASLAQHLDAVCKIRVAEAQDGEAVLPGRAYIAPGDWHMRLSKRGGEYRIALEQSEARSGHRPSVDVLFESLAELREVRRHLVLMTGMGSDGAKGMRLARDAGAETAIAESEETCVVYGMPRAAVENGSVTNKLPLPEIAGKLLQAVARQNR